MSTSAHVKPKSTEIPNMELNNIVFRKIRGIGPEAKLILLAIINFRDQYNNTCWPSRATLAKVTDISERNVTRVLGKLMNEYKFLARVYGTGERGRVSKYMVTVDREGKHDPSKVPEHTMRIRKKADPWAGHGMAAEEAEKVFHAWAKTFGIEGLSFTDERRAMIKARAKEGLKYMEALVAIKGYRLAKGVYIPSAEKTRGEIPSMNDFCLIFRDDTHVRQFFQDALKDMAKRGLYLSEDGTDVLNKNGDSIVTA